MMNEDHTENGYINAEGEEKLKEGEMERRLTDSDINSPRTSTVTSPSAAGLSKDVEPVMEYFDRKSDGGGGGGSETGSEENSPRLLDKEKDSDSHHSRSYVTVSPPVSPGPSQNSYYPSGKERTDSTEEPIRTEYDYDVDEVVKPKPKPHPRKKLPHHSQDGGSVSSEVEDALGKVSMLEDGQDWDLVVAITERERNGMKPDAKSSDAYISYKICTQSSRPSNQFEKSYYEVWRRYSDFEWLGEMLEKHRSTLIVPPLPGKQLARYFDQKSEEFLNERQQALNKFLKRLAAHPYFSFDRHFKMFITAGPEQFASFMTETTSGGSKLLGSVTTTIKMAANSLRLKNPDPEFAKEAKYFEELEDKLGAVERVASRIHTEREELCSDLEEFSASLVQWSLNEPQLVHCIRRMGSCVDTCDSTSKTLNEKNALSLIAASKEYQLYCASGVSAVRRRDGLQLDKEKAGEEREKKKKVHDEAANARKLQKLPKLADDLQKAGVEAERTLDDLSIANEQLRVDIEKWKEAKNKELGKVMSVFADNHIAYHQKCCDEWEGVLGLLRAPSSLFSPPDFLKDEGTCQSLSSPTDGVEGNEGAPTTSHTPMYKNVDLERSESPDLFT